MRGQVLDWCENCRQKLSRRKIWRILQLSEGECVTSAPSLASLSINSAQTLVSVRANSSLIENGRREPRSSLLVGHRRNGSACPSRRFSIPRRLTNVPRLEIELESVPIEFGVTENLGLPNLKPTKGDRRCHLAHGRWCCTVNSTAAPRLAIATPEEARRANTEPTPRDAGEQQLPASHRGGRGRSR